MHPSIRVRLSDVPPSQSGAADDLFSTCRANRTTQRSFAMTAEDLPVEVDLLWKGAHPLAEVLALLTVVSVVPAAWFGLMALAM